MGAHVAVVMPAYNENDGLGEFLVEIDCALRADGVVADFVVVDDHSMLPIARTLDVALSPKLRERVQVLRNAVNVGHGPSALRAYRAGLAGHGVVIHVDGDGQFDGVAISAVLQALDDRGVAHGRRIGRDDPW